MPEPGVAAEAERLIGERAHLLVRIGVVGLVVILAVVSATLAWFMDRYFVAQSQLTKANSAAAAQRSELETQLDKLSQTDAILASQVDAFRQQLIAAGIKPIEVTPVTVPVFTPIPGISSTTTTTTAPSSSRTTFTTTAPPTTTTTVGSHTAPTTTTTATPCTIPVIGCVPGTSQGKTNGKAK